MSKRCIKCGQEIGDNAIYCRFCGHDQNLPVPKEPVREPVKPVRDPDVPVKKDPVKTRVIEDDQEEYLKNRKDQIIHDNDEDDNDDDNVVISKKTLKIVGGVIALAIIAVCVWFFFLRNPVLPPQPPIPDDSEQIDLDTDSEHDDNISDPVDLDDSDDTYDEIGEYDDNDYDDTVSDPVDLDDEYEDNEHSEYESYVSTDPDDYPEDFLIPGSDNHYITKSDYDWMDEDEVQRAINEIYARRGRVFKESDYGKFLQHCNWYTPIYSADEFEEEWFNSYEEKNLKKLVAHRKKLRDKKKN